MLFKCAGIDIEIKNRLFDVQKEFYYFGDSLIKLSDGIKFEIIFIS